MASNAENFPFDDVIMNYVNVKTHGGIYNWARYRAEQQEFLHIKQTQQV